MIYTQPAPPNFHPRHHGYRNSLWCNHVTRSGKSHAAIARLTFYTGGLQVKARTFFCRASSKARTLFLAGFK